METVTFVNNQLVKFKIFNKLINEKYFPNLKSLNLENNCIGDKGVIQILKNLALNNSLEILNLSINRITDFSTF